MDMTENAPYLLDSAGQCFRLVGPITTLGRDPFYKLGPSRPIIQRTGQFRLGRFQILGFSSQFHYLPGHGQAMIAKIRRPRAVQSIDSFLDFQSVTHGVS